MQATKPLCKSVQKGRAESDSVREGPPYVKYKRQRKAGNTNGGVDSLQRV